ncbi:MAG: BTAD domain-containing putative transcriptional regulator [Desulfopila sp.]
MQATATAFHSSIPSNKFYPPHIATDQSLLRSRLVEEILPGKRRQNRIIAIEAQAGQGKTTLAYQYVTHHRHNHAWYQIGKEDIDPVILLSGLLQSLKGAMQDFSCPQLEEILDKGEIGPMDLMHCANILLGDIDRFLQGKLYIVFDDLHLINDAELTNSLIAYLLDTSPPRLHFVLTSRHPFELKSKAIRNRNAVAYLDTQDLALSSDEIESLFNDIFKRSISVSEARHIEDVTSGWVMGIVLAAHPMSGKKTMPASNGAATPLLGSPSQHDMLEYFQDEIFSNIPDRLHTAFLKLSFLDEIHSDLAKRITGKEDIDIILAELTQENLFIYNLDRESSTFRFHHLFQEFLQAKARKKLGADEITTIYDESASFFLKRDMVDKALSCYQLGGQYDKMDELLFSFGTNLLAQNRTLTILQILQSIKETTLLQYGWLTLFSGILGSDFHPKKTLDHLESARRLFRDRGEETGELLALAQILYYHFVVSGRYHDGAALLARTEELLQKQLEKLGDNVIVLVARNLAAGFCFFSADMERAGKYITKARRIAIENGIRNFVASTVFIKAYIELLSGNRKKFRQEVEISHSLLNDPLVSMSNKLTLRVMYLCNLSMHGDHANYFHQQQLIRESIDDKVVKQTVVAPYLAIWGCSCFTSMGETAQGLDLVNKGVNISSSAQTDHMLSQLLQWQAYILARHGNFKSAAVKIRESTKLRHIAGGPFYEAFNLIMAGAVYAALVQKTKAAKSFERAIKLAEKIPSPYLVAGALLHRSHFLLKCSSEKDSLDDLERGLAIMKEQDYDHFWGWEPTFMQELLQTAAIHKVHASFAEKLAKKRLKIKITESGKSIPLLRFTILDGFFFSIANDDRIAVDQITPLQREMLSLLLFAKDKKVSQEKIQLTLWPDSPPEKSRKKLDTLLGRLRNPLSVNLPVPAKNYIVLNKGIVSLENVTCDVDDFLRNCEEGFRHARREEFWQAGNRFHEALSYWKSSLPTDTFRNDTIFAFEDSLVATFEKTAIQWASILAKAHRQEEAIPVLQKLLKTDPLSEEATVMLCRLYAATYQPLLIRKTLQNYRQALQNIDYEDDEIDSIITDITNQLAG